MKVLGLMSGTSMDGLDCCLCELSIAKNFNYNILAFNTYKYTNDIISKISNSVGVNNIDSIKSLDDYLGKIFKNISEDFLNNKTVDLISSHGQTIIHQSGEKSIQVGNPKYMYDKFKIPIVHNFRQKDISIGGTGAPLVPYLDWLLFNKAGRNIVTINIGGISNLTYIPSSGLRNDVLGFDTGPGMSLIDEYVKLEFNNIYDCNSKYSLKGNICDSIVNYLLEDNYIRSKPPKSTTREYFGHKYLIKIKNKFKYINKYDFLRSLVNFTAKSISYNIYHFLKNIKIDEVVISGGGAHHQLLINDLKENVSNLSLMNKYKISVDNKEAFLMAVLGYTCYNNIINNMPSVTGAYQEDIYGEIYE